MDYNKKIEQLEAKRTDLEAQLNTKGIDKEEKHDIHQWIIAIDNQITAYVSLLSRTPAVARSEAQSGDKSESVASTSHYAGLNQFQVHIPSVYDSELRHNIQRDFEGVSGACIETRWQTVGGRVGVSLTVWTTQKGRSTCITILQKYLNRLPEEREMFPLLHRPPREFRVKHHSKGSTIEVAGDSSGATNVKPNEVE